MLLTMPLLDSSSMFVATVEFLPPFMLLIYGTLSVNDTMEPIVNRCYTIMVSPNHVVSEDAQHSRTSVNNSPTNHGDQRETFAEQTTGAMKLALLVEKMPCTILLLGWKVSWGTILTSIAAILLTQSLGAVGLGD